MSLDACAQLWCRAAMPARTAVDHVAPGVRTGRQRFLSIVALSVARAREGILVKASLVLALAMTTGALVVAALIAHKTADPTTLGQVPLAAAVALAWAAGVLVAFSASSGALVRDQKQGTSQLIASRGATPLTYVTGRALGLGLLLFVVSGSGAIAAALGEAITAPRGALVIARGLVAGLGFALMFALAVAPLSLAALGARSRAGGYFVLLLVLVLPELFVGSMDRLLPEGWGNLASVPSALSAFAGGLSPGSGDPARAIRAFVVIVIVAVVSTAIVRAQLSRAEELAS